MCRTTKNEIDILIAAASDVEPLGAKGWAVFTIKFHDADDEAVHL